MGNSAEIKNYTMGQLRPSSVFTPACKKDRWYVSKFALELIITAEICIQLVRLVSFPVAVRIVGKGG